MMAGDGGLFKQEEGGCDVSGSTRRQKKRVFGTTEPDLIMPTPGPKETQALFLERIIAPNIRTAAPYTTTNTHVGMATG